MVTDEPSGAALARAYFDRLVRPALAAGLPDLRYAAGRLGAGSDVLGLDDVTSRDHDWGLRLELLVPPEDVRPVRDLHERVLPAELDGRPTRFPSTGETASRLQVAVDPLEGFLLRHLGFDPRANVSIHDWLSLTGQAVLEVVAGPVFADADGGLGRAREALTWYPEDVWRHLLACDWARIAQELPLMGRAADVGDDLGSRVIAARLVHVVMHLAFLLERRWPPYAKWFGTAFAALPCAPAIAPRLCKTLETRDRTGREAGIAAALEHLLGMQRALGLSHAERATIPFWDRGHVHPDPAIVAGLLAPVTDESVRALPLGRGSAEQRTDVVDVLVDPVARRRLVAG